MSKIINECNKKSYTCIFMDQPTAYKDNISEDLKSRLHALEISIERQIYFDFSNHLFVF